jgi:hypothetical protein
MEVAQGRSDIANWAKQFAPHSTPWQTLGVNGYCCRIDVLTATQSKVDVLVEPWANLGASVFSKYDMHFAPILCRAVLWRDSGVCEESVYISGDQLHITLHYWGLRVVVCDTQLTSRRRCWLRWLESLRSQGRCHKADENSPTLIPAMAVALCLQGRR